MRATHAAVGVRYIAKRLILIILLHINVERKSPIAPPVFVVLVEFMFVLIVLV